MKLLHYSSGNGEIEYVVATDDDLTEQTIAEHCRPGCELAGAFELQAVSVKLDSCLPEGRPMFRR